MKINKKSEEEEKNLKDQMLIKEANTNKNNNIPNKVKSKKEIIEVKEKKYRRN